MDIEKIRSDLQMEDLYFVDCSIHREASIEDGALSFNLQKQIEEFDNNRFSVTLTLDVSKEANDLTVKVILKGIFSLNGFENDPQMAKTMIQTNTVAIMFPFIRSQVSLLTTQPGLNPIIIPPINTSKFDEH